MAVQIAANMGLTNLQNEPNRLMSEAERLNAELEVRTLPTTHPPLTSCPSRFDRHTRLPSLASLLQALVMENYKIFVENLTCSVHLRSEVTTWSLPPLPCRRAF